MHTVHAHLTSVISRAIIIPVRPDYDDRAVTVRERDSREQDRVSLDQLEGYLAERLG